MSHLRTLNSSSTVSIGQEIASEIDDSHAGTNDLHLTARPQLEQDVRFDPTSRHRCKDDSGPGVLRLCSSR